MVSFDHSPIAWLNRPYFDLGPSNGGALHLYGVEFSYNNLVNDSPYLYGLQVNLPTIFRESLIQQTGMTQYQVDNPLQLPSELRTERWNKLCEYLTHYQTLPNITKLRVAQLLKSLCFHQTILEYIPRRPDSEIGSDSVVATLAFRRAMSNLTLHVQSRTPYNRDEFEFIANHTPSGSAAKVSAALQLVVQEAKTAKNLETTEYWRTVVTKEIQNIKPSLDEFSCNLLMSIYNRAVVFVPLLQGNKEKVVEEMDLCEHYAESVPCENEQQRIMAYENRNIIFESRTKEALWLGDLDLAEERARQLTQRDPLDAKYRVELGEVLIKLGKIEEAGLAYESAIRLGPPMTEVAWFMAGQCYEALGELEKACDCYLSSLEIDPVAIGALERLVGLAPRLGNSGIVNWSRQRLAKLQTQKQKTSAEQEPIYRSEASAELKGAPQAMVA